jgi:hypothetical protein
MLIWLCEDYSAVQDQRDGHDAARKCTTLATQGLTVFLRCIKHWISQSFRWRRTVGAALLFEATGALNTRSAKHVRDQYDGRHTHYIEH